MPGDATHAGREGGGYWITKRVPVESRPFTHASTYQTEVLDGKETAEKQLQQSIGLACTIARYETARRTL